MATNYDVIIVGAGLQGLCTAKTFLAIDPSLTIHIVDDKESVGGVWAKEKLYTGLRSNNLQGWFEFSDFPILEADLGEHQVKERELLTGEALNAYFTKYTEHFGLLDLIQLQTSVLEARQDNSRSTSSSPNHRWQLLVETRLSDGTRLQSELNCGKLIVATGQASRPRAPKITGSENFDGPIFHSTDLGKLEASILNDAKQNHITVLGGSKSAHDIVHKFASAGKQITWIFRRTGRGMMPMAKPYSQMGPWSVWVEGLLMTRPLSWFNCAPWSTGDGFGWVRWLLHGTRIGRAFVRGYWGGLTGETLSQSGVLRNEKTKCMVPDASMMWYGTQTNCLNYETDFYETICRDNVEIVREDVDRLETGRIVLADGRTIDTDLLFYATGYKFGPTFPLKPSEKNLAWGVPVSPDADDLFPSLNIKADKELFARFPELRQGPTTRDWQPELTPWRLWRFIAPPSQVCTKDERALVFLNTILAVQNCLKAEITSLWAYAYLFDELRIEPQSESSVTYEAAVWSRFGRWSKPMGAKGQVPDFMSDSMPYFDCLLRDLGLRSWRKGRGILGEIFGRWYLPQDYKGLTDEWKALRSSQLKKTV